MGPNPCSVSIDRSRDHGTESEYRLEMLIVCSRLPSVDRVSTAAVQSSLTQCRFKPLRRGRGCLPRQNRVEYKCNCCKERQPGTPPRLPCRELTQHKEQWSVPRSYLFQWPFSEKLEQMQQSESTHARADHASESTH